jgi:hypothetical protein
LIIVISTFSLGGITCMYLGRSVRQFFKTEGSK